MNSIHDAVDAYSAVIARDFAAHVKPYRDRQRSDPEAARAEAAAYFVLRGSCQAVCLTESPSTGGPDFTCHDSGKSFVVEVTALGCIAAERYSGLSNQSPCGSFGFLTDQLKARVRSKACQVAIGDVPRLVLIYCEHSAGAVLVGPDAAERMLSGDLQIAVSLDGRSPDLRQATRLRESAFFRQQNGAMESCRRSVSGVLLMHGAAESCTLVGALHPDPARVFNVDMLPNVPFCKLKYWPIHDGQVEIVWVIGSPQPRSYDLGMLALVYGGMKPI